MSTLTKPMTVNLEGCQPSAETPENATSYDTPDSAPSSRPSSSDENRPEDPDLDHLAMLWPQLPKAIRIGILAMAEAASAEAGRDGR